MRMNKIWMVVIPILIAVIIGTYITSNADGVTIVPGSADDPIITKSYVDEQLKKLTGQTPGASAIDETAMKKLITQEVQSGLKLEIIKLDGKVTKQILMAAPGTEFVVRTGKAIAVSTDGNGIPDLTGGKDIPAGQAISLNHLLLFPTEHRGIAPDPKNTEDIYVMVRGAYTLVKP